MYSTNSYMSNTIIFKHSPYHTNGYQPTTRRASTEKKLKSNQYVTGQTVYTARRHGPTKPSPRVKKPKRVLSAHTRTQNSKQNLHTTKSPAAHYYASPTVKRPILASPSVTSFKPKHPSMIQRSLKKSTRYHTSKKQRSRQSGSKKQHHRHFRMESETQPTAPTVVVRNNFVKSSIGPDDTQLQNSFLSPLSDLMSQFKYSDSSASKSTLNITNMFEDVEEIDSPYKPVVSTSTTVNSSPKKRRHSGHKTESSVRGYKHIHEPVTVPKPRVSSKLQTQHEQEFQAAMSPLSNILAKYAEQSAQSQARYEQRQRKTSRHNKYNSQRKSSNNRHERVKKSSRRQSSTSKKSSYKTRESRYHQDRYSTEKKASMVSMHKRERMIETNTNSGKSSHRSRDDKKESESFSVAKTMAKQLHQNLDDLMNKNVSTSSTNKRSKSDPWNVKTLSLKDLSVKSMLGEGAFSKVYLVKFKKNKKVVRHIDGELHSKHLALKVINKKDRSKDKSLEWEKFVLSQMKHPFIVQYYGSFLDKSKLCILTEFVIGGEILFHFENSTIGRFNNITTQFYIGEIICALEYLHSKGYVYRDLKPENILLDKDGHVKIVDFGFAKKVRSTERTYTLCGSKEYVAPEVLTGSGHSFAADYWSLGVLTYEFAVGHLPFPTQECNPYEVLGVMQSTQIIYPNYVDKDCMDFIKQLLVFKPSQRLGCYGANNNNNTGDDTFAYETKFSDVKNHSWFTSNNFDWKACNRKELTPPIKPQYNSNDDASNFATARFDLDSNNNDDDLLHF